MRLFPRVISESEAPYEGGRVRVLPPEVAHRIAAGEVIERPASAAKELVENALDAGATRVEVEIEGGGIRLVRVRDDGSGMSAQDARRSVGRHATSKISYAEDLARVLSLGFRGEALHAISSVSALTLTTGQRDALPGTSGTRVRLFAGGPAEVSPASHPAGTTVEARDLFLNLPVRRGFLGTERAEANADRDNGATLPCNAYTRWRAGDEARKLGDQRREWPGRGRMRVDTLAGVAFRALLLEGEECAETEVALQLRGENDIARYLTSRRAS